MTDYWPLVVTVLVAALPGIIALLGARRKDRADVAGKYQEIASRQAADNLRLEKCQNELEKRVGELERAVMMKDMRITAQDIEISELRDKLQSDEGYINQLVVYIDLLIGLLEEGHYNVPPRPKRPDKLVGKNP